MAAAAPLQNPIGQPLGLNPSDWINLLQRKILKCDQRVREVLYRSGDELFEHFADIGASILEGVAMGLILISFRCMWICLAKLYVISCPFRSDISLLYTPNPQFFVYW